MNSQNPEHRAKEIAFLLLKFRPRSKQEIYQRLKKRQFDDKVIKATLNFLGEKGFVDDDNFARLWIASRLKKPLGLRKIIEELRLKGIDKVIIQKHIAELKREYLEDEIIAKIAQEKFSRLKEIEPKKAKRRVFGYLVRRGFSTGTVIEVINKIKI